LTECARLGRYFAVVEEVQPTPKLADISPLEQAIEDIEEEQRKVDADRARSTTLVSLKTPPDLASVPALEGTVRELAAAAEEVGFLTQRIACLATLRETPAYSDTASMEGMIGSLDSAEQLVGKLVHRTQLLGMLRLVPELSDPSPLEQFVESLKGAIEVVQDKQRFVDITAIDADRAREELTAADQTVPPVLAPVRSVTPFRTPAILAGGILVAAIVVLLVVFARNWFSGSDRRPDPRPSGDDIAAAPVRAPLEAPPTRPATKSASTPDNETAKRAFVN
jgi:hypothetical protein